MTRAELEALQAKAAALKAQSQQPINSDFCGPMPQVEPTPHIAQRMGRQYDGIANWFSAIPAAWSIGRSGN